MKYKVGDKVIIKSWDEMAAQYGTDVDGDINTPGGWLFTRWMRKWCNQVLTIREVHCKYAYLMEHCENYKFTDVMIAGLATDESPAAEKVDHPSHYNRKGAMECIDEMVLVFGQEAAMHFCLLNAWKYRYRAADKNGEEDLKKSDWYLRKYRELRDAV